MTSKIIPVDPFDLIIFGITGDLAKRKLIPVLYYRFSAGQIPEKSRIIGLARGDWSPEEFRAQALDALRQGVAEQHFDAETAERFVSCLVYSQVDVMNDDGWGGLQTLLKDSANPVRAFCSLQS